MRITTKLAKNGSVQCYVNGAKMAISKVAELILSEIDERDNSNFTVVAPDGIEFTNNAWEMEFIYGKRAAKKIAEYIKVVAEDAKSNEPLQYATNEADPAEYAITVEAQEVATDAEIELANDVKVELPKGEITVESGAKAFELVAEYFPNGLNFCKASKGFNREDVFSYSDDKEDLFAVATCTPDNSRVEVVEIIDTNESDSKRKPLFIVIEHKADAVEADADREALIAELKADGYNFVVTTNKVSDDSTILPTNTYVKTYEKALAELKLQAKFYAANPACDGGFVFATLDGELIAKGDKIADYEQTLNSDNEGEPLTTESQVKEVNNAEISNDVIETKHGMTITVKRGANGKVSAYYVDGKKIRKDAVEKLIAARHNEIIVVSFYEFTGFKSIVRSPYRLKLILMGSDSKPLYYSEAAVEELGLLKINGTTHSFGTQWLCEAEKIPAAELAGKPHGELKVGTGEEAFALVAPYFPKPEALTFDIVQLGFANQDEFVFRYDGEENLLLIASCTADNARVESLEVVNSAQQGYRRHILLVHISSTDTDPDDETQQDCVDDYSVNVEAQDLATDAKTELVNGNQRQEIVNSTDDDFMTKLADLKSVVDAADKEDSEARAAEVQAYQLWQAAKAKAQQAADKRSAAIRQYNRLGTKKAKDLTTSLVVDDLDLFCNANIKVTNQQGEVVARHDLSQIFISFYDGVFKVCASWDKLGIYDTTAQIQTVFSQLKSAIEHGVSEFKFPTIDQLNNPNERSCVL